MTEDFSSAPWPFHAGPVLTLRPRRLMHSPERWVVDVSADDLVGLAQGPDAMRRLRARRGFLGETPANRRLGEILRATPEEFGVVGTVVLVAEAVEVAGAGDGRGFGGELRVHAVGCVDGFQRLRIIADVAAVLGAAHVGRSTVRLEVHCGPGSAVVSRLHREAGGIVNAPTAQDGLIRCPHIARLVGADWEEAGFFDPRRGAVAGPHGRLFTMPEVTRALACLSAAPSPEAANLVATEQGLEAFWGSVGTPLYLGVFHDRLSPVGVLRAVEAWRTARDALSGLPGKLKGGAGHLIPYAPDLICWAACREVLPLGRLHAARSAFDWHGVIRDQLPAVTRRTAERLVRRYGEVRAARGSRGDYKHEAPLLDVWLDVLAAGR
ncbi:hypothetical protein [Streptomyces sp. NBC_01268]|uniref:hypothetical protein n=1 Tax=Streptomyces sp. NBC_01268 TaxID=2903806 RepID=UPI002E308603|nr:hypothetical protein [Streptomyces sp. NBC_01268]